MATEDRCVTIAPYFKISEGKAEACRVLREQAVARTSQEAGCLYYGFRFDGDAFHCREGYTDGDAAVAHLENIGPVLGELLKAAELTRLGVHGIEEEVN